jgi:hypothetical protein
VSAPQTSTSPGRWALEYFYDRDEDTFTINDFSVVSNQFGIAVGRTVTRHDKTKPFSVVMRDGKTWNPQPIPENGVSVFFLNDSLGWLVGEKTLWRTEEGGRDWKKLKKLQDVMRVHFLDAKHGFAIGQHKTVLQTHDGGETWDEVAEAKKPSTNPDYTSYNWVEFQNAKTGIIVGSGIPPRRSESDKPAWLDPQAAEKQREWPVMTIALETKDGGATWRSQTAPAFGITTRFRAAASGQSLVLIRFTNAFDWPSELYLSKPGGGGTTRVYREKKRMVTDCAWWPENNAVVAAVEPPGRLHMLPIPGKLHILTSSNLKEWKEMKVDYRAFANRAMLAVTGPKDAWVATDTGQILRFTN